MGDSRQKANIVKSILNRHFPNGAERPKGLLADFYRAIGEAEMRGYNDCLRFFEAHEQANDNAREIANG